jgi:hypothetical protein
MRAGVFPRWAGLLLIVGLVSLGASFVNPFLIATLVFGMIGFGGMGYALVTATDEAIPQRVAA